MLFHGRGGPRVRVYDLFCYPKRDQCDTSVQAERAGMTKITEQPPSKKGLRIADTLLQLGFNIQFFGSEEHVLDKLQTLKAEDVTRIREAFIQNNTPCFMKYFFTHKPYGKQKLFAEKLMKTSLERLAHLIKVCGLLLQTKVYLFWQRSKSSINVEKRGL